MASIRLEQKILLSQQRPQGAEFGTLWLGLGLGLGLPLVENSQLFAQRTVRPPICSLGIPFQLGFSWTRHGDTKPNKV